MHRYIVPDGSRRKNEWSGRSESAATTRALCPAPGSEDGMKLTHDIISKNVTNSKETTHATGTLNIILYFDTDNSGVGSIESRYG